MAFSFTSTSVTFNAGTSAFDISWSVVNEPVSTLYAIYWSRDSLLSGANLGVSEGVISSATSPSSLSNLPEYYGTTYYFVIGANAPPPDQFFPTI